MPIPFTGKCDFVYDPKGDTPCRDLLLPVTEEEANEVVSLEWPAWFRFGAATSAYQVEGGIVDTNWNRWEDMRVREGDGKETVRPNADGSVGAGFRLGLGLGLGFGLEPVGAEAQARPRTCGTSSRASTCRSSSSWA